MNQTPSSSNALPRWPLFVVALVALLPFVLNYDSFKALFYFEDEWDLLDTWAKVGFTQWTSAVFAENFMPLFKSIWGGAILLFDGSYISILTLVWLNHAVNAALVARIAQRTGAENMPAVFAGLVFGLTAINYETLAWTVQWSAVLSISFFLLGVFVAVEWSAHERDPNARAAVLLALLTLASALCFSRGVITGFVFAVWLFFAPAGPTQWTRRVILALVPIAPSVFVGLWIFLHSSGNHQHLAETLRSMFLWGLHNYAQAPLRVLFTSESPSLLGLVSWAVLKTTLYIVGLILAPRSTRAVLLALVTFELGNAFLLAFGRYHTGLAAAASSRYQYGSLITLLPFVAIVFTRLLLVFVRPRAFRLAVAAVLTVITAWQIQRPWHSILSSWAVSHGRETRAILPGSPAGRESENLSRLPWMSNERVRYLVSKCHLH